MNRSGLLIGVASVLAGTSVLLVVLGGIYNPILLALAVPFAAAAYFLWQDATGRVSARFRRRERAATAGGRSTAAGGRRRSRRTRREPRSRREARRVLGVGPDAGPAEIRSAYRSRVKEVHPDAENGSEEAFKRVSEAYDRLQD